MSTENIKTWEHLVVPIGKNFLNEEIGKYGKEGWELVTVLPREFYQYDLTVLVFFKRPVSK